MADQSQFFETYLREIGVQTPVSLFLSGSETQASDVVPIAASPLIEAAEPQLSVISQPKATAPVCTSDLTGLAERVSGCTLCSLAQTRTKAVFGVGNPQADLVFIGEAPGRDEDLQGEPFVGRAGQLLDRMLMAMGLDRSVVYIMNTVKCRPPNNRDPKPEEVQACNLWFEQQLDMLQPKMICLLGRVAAQTVLASDQPLRMLQGRWHDYRGIPTYVTYHPAFLLRSPQQKQRSWQDLCEVMVRYRALVS